LAWGDATLDRGARLTHVDALFSQHPCGAPILHAEQAEQYVLGIDLAMSVPFRLSLC
jgi:hypothetical protein